MSRDEFIDGYMRRSGMEPKRRTADGFRVGDRGLVAVPCDCGDEMCQGWAMVRDDPDEIEEYAAFYGPRPVERGA
jgi:hypothetical protein